jgi:hypothetical protein
MVPVKFPVAARSGLTIDVVGMFRLAPGGGRKRPSGVTEERWIMLRDSEGVILPAECRFPWGWHGLEYWTPKRSDVLEAEARIECFLQSVEPEIAKKLGRYKRQYSGVLKDKRRLIYLNFFVVHDRFHNDWSTKPVDVEDGGDSYFQVFTTGSSG